MDLDLLVDLPDFFVFLEDFDLEVFLPEPLADFLEEDRPDLLPELLLRAVLLPLSFRFLAFFPFFPFFKFPLSSYIVLQSPVFAACGGGHTPHAN